MNTEQNVRVLLQNHKGHAPHIQSVNHLRNVDAVNDNYLVRCCDFYGWVPKSFLDTQPATD